ncbi:CvpA family protein [Candidatus Pelagibacter sp.]|nr:CvpA family protein [Candidatus Pelagibacter sp.]
MEVVKDFITDLYTFDIIYLVFTVLSLITCTKKGFLLSILSASKWLLAYVVTLFLFPKVKPFFEDIIDSEYVLDLAIGLGLFIIIIFLILLINKGINRAVTYSGLGNLDRIFGFFFGFVRSYVIVVCIYTTINIVYNHKKWPINLEEAFTYAWVEKGSNYLIKEFPDKKDYEETKEKVQDI